MYMRTEVIVVSEGRERTEVDWAGLTGVNICHSGSTHSDKRQDFLDLSQLLSVIIPEIENLGM